MKNNTSVVAVLLFVFIYLLLRPFSILFSNAPNPSFFGKEHLIEGETYSSIWINAIQINNGLFLLIVLSTMILLYMAFKKWHNLKLYDTSIIKKLDSIAYLFIAEGIITCILYFATVTKDFTQTDVFNVLQLDVQHGLFMIVIGLLFALITSILTNAKVVKDENDLTI